MCRSRESFQVTTLRARAASRTFRRKITSLLPHLKVHYRILKVVLVFLSALVPIILLYAINPESFNHTYNGRSYYLFFIWLIVLGFAFDWEKYAGAKISDTPVKSRVAFGLMLALPTSYLFAANFFGLNNALMEWASPYITGTLALERLGDLPLAAELLVFAFLFGVIFLYAYRWNGLKGFLPAVGLIAAVGLINLVTILYYGGGFTPFQILAPATAQTTASFLNLMGYRTMLVVSESNFVPTLLVISSQSSVVLRIGWPCAGVDSLLIYTVVILMFLGKISVPWLHRVAYFVVGAGVTFFINVLRIYTMFMIKLNHGDVGPFHDFYGQLYSTIWIVSYIMLIVVSRVLWSRFHERRQLNKSLKNHFYL